MEGNIINKNKLLIGIIVALFIGIGCLAIIKPKNSANIDNDAAKKHYEQTISTMRRDQKLAEEKDVNSDKWKLDKSLFKQNRGSITYSPMGDSLTAGFFASKDSTRFVSVLSRYINEGLGYDVKVEGVSGYGGLSENGLNAAEQVVEQSPDLVSIEYGTNDADPKRKISVESFEDNLESIVNKLNSGYKKPKIFLITTWKTDKTGEYNKAIKKIGGKYKLPVVDITKLSQDAENSGPAGKDTFKGKSDDFHPNDKGMERIARTIYSENYKYISESDD